MYVGLKENQKELAREQRAIDTRIEITKLLEEASMDIDRESMEFVSMALLDRLVNENPIQISDETKAEAHTISHIERLRASGNALEAYNGYLVGLMDLNISLTEEDMAYLSSLDNIKGASIVAIKSPITNHYNTVYTDSDSKDYIMIREDGTVLITNFDGVRANYYDTNIDISSNKELTGEEIAGLVPIGEFINTNNMEVSGYCFPTFGKATPSAETIATIAEVYGDAVAECVNIFGLPVAYYDAKDFDEALRHQDGAVKGLNN